MRKDGRRHHQLRPLKFTPRVSRYAEGSCQARMGHTTVLCTATVEEGVPRFLKDTGKGWVTAEYAMLPRSCQTRIPRDISRGKMNSRSQEIQRLIGRSLRAAVDLKCLGERTVWIDCDVLQGDGGTRCAAITGAYVALYQALKGLRKKGLFEAFPITGQVAAVSVGIVGGHPVLDLNYEEDASADVDMNVVMTGTGKFIEVQGTAERGPFSEADMKKLISLARSGIRQLHVMQRKVLGIK